jgi:hypothetical protein
LSGIVKTRGKDGSGVPSLKELARATAVTIGLGLITIFPSPMMPSANAVTPANIIYNDQVCDLTLAGYQGSGNSSDPYLIPDADALWEISDCSTSASGQVYFQLTSDIDVSVATRAVTSSPIGYSNSSTVYSFSGVLDGDQFEIYGIVMDKAEQIVGLFGQLYGAQVQNLSLAGYFRTQTSVQQGAEFPPAGALAARSSSTSKISSVSVNATVIGTAQVGGFVGHAEGDLEVSSSSMTGTVSGTSNYANYFVGFDGIGGLAGVVEGDVEIDGSSNLAQVSGRRNVGGLIGAAQDNADVTDSSNRGLVSGDHLLGGFIGASSDTQQGPTERATIRNSENYGRVSATGVTGYVGGLIGLASGGVTLEDALNSASSIFGLYLVGGLIGGVGQELTIRRSTNTSDVSSIFGDNIGGLVGETQGKVLIAQSSNLGQVLASGNNVGGLVGHTDIDNGAGDATKTIQFSESRNRGAISGVNNVGGLVGRGDFKPELLYTYNSGAVQATGDAAGGLIGRANGYVGDADQSLVAFSYNSASVTGRNYAGGLIGLAPLGADLKRSYNAGSVTSAQFSDGLVGSASSTVATSSLVSSQATSYANTTNLATMQEASAFPGFNFTATFGFGSCSENGGLPLLRTFEEVQDYNSSGCQQLLTANNAICELAPAGYAGSGSAQDPYLISDAESLWELTDCSTTQSAPAHFRLTNTITVSDAVTAPTQSPIGFSSSTAVSFSGVLDGNNQLITGISMSTSSFGVGLFAYLHDASISNLAISGSFSTTTTNTALASHSAGALAIYSLGNLALSSISNRSNVSGNHHVGGFVGLTEVVSVEHSQNLGAITGTGDNVGGLFGYQLGVLTITSSNNAGQVGGRDYVGGFAGQIIADATITSSENAGQVAGRSYVGGLFGFVNGGVTIGWSDNDFDATVAGTGQVVGGMVGMAVSVATEGVFNKGNVSAGSEKVGGIVGYATNEANLDLTANDGRVTGGSRAGGLIGYVAGSGQAIVANSFNRGRVTGSDEIGGIIGKAFVLADFTNVVNGGRVTGNDRVGGLLGYGDNAFYTSAGANFGYVTGNDYVGGLAGYVDQAFSATSSFNQESVIGRNYVGGLAGFVDDELSMRDSYNSGSITGAAYVGGLTGYALDHAQLVSSHNTGTVSASSDYVAGLIARVFSGGGVISSSFNSGNVSGLLYVGGLIASVEQDATVHSSSNSGRLSGNNNVGGLLGYVNSGSANVNVSRNTGAISGIDQLGGLVGYSRLDASITSSFNSANVSGSGNRIGGLIGFVDDGTATIYSSYNSGSISGDSWVGGLVGDVDSDTSAIDIAVSYNGGGVTGNSEVDGLVGRVARITTSSAYTAVASSFAETVSTSDMQVASTFIGFDFNVNNTWGFGTCTDNNGYPMLRVFAQVSSYSSIGCQQSQSQPGNSTPTPSQSNNVSANESERFESSLPSVSGTKAVVQLGSLLVLSGHKLDLVRQVKLADQTLRVISQSNQLLVLDLTGVEPGIYSLRFVTSNGNLTLNDFLEVQRPISTEQSTSSSAIISGLNPRSSWLNKAAIQKLMGIFEGRKQVTCIAYQDRAGLVARQKAVSRANHACRYAKAVGLNTRVYVFGSAPKLADSIKVLFR